MRTKLDADRRIAIPEEVADLLDLRAGDEFDVALVHGEIVLTPVRDATTVEGVRQLRIDLQTSLG